jgi:hypothetical protein
MVMGVVLLPRGRSDPVLVGSLNVDSDVGRYLLPERHPGNDLLAASGPQRGQGVRVMPLGDLRGKPPHASASQSDFDRELFACPEAT